jgi:hypothetical protein
MNNTVLVVIAAEMLDFQAHRNKLHTCTFLFQINASLWYNVIAGRKPQHAGRLLASNGANPKPRLN